MSKRKDPYRWNDQRLPPQNYSEDAEVYPSQELGMRVIRAAVGAPSCPWTEVNAGMELHLLSMGYTAREIEQLKVVVDHARNSNYQRITCEPYVWFRPQARKRGAPLFATKRLPYKGRRKGSPRRMPGVIVWDVRHPGGFVWPFPEVGDECSQ